MKRLRRILFNALTLLSALLFVGMCGWWARSSGARDAGYFQLGKGSQVAMESDHGSLCFEMYPSNNPSGWARDWMWSPAIRWRPRRWFSWEVSASLRGDPGREVPPHVRAPYWLLIIVVAIPPLLWLHRTGSRRRKAGHCPVCGYDLRATPGRCPECGAAPKATAGLTS